jgi:Predicted dehydrogenases and related proteins
MKVALIEASHWHVPLYLDPLETTGIEVVAVSDAEQARGPEIATRFGSKLYSSSRELLEREQFDFAFVFGRHSEMPTLAEALIARKTPFALEKPCGVNMSQVTRLRRLAEEANIYCAIPFIFRMSDLLAAIGNAEGSIPANFNYMSFRFIVGSPERYKAAGAGWATDPVFSGGGSTINVATHFIDLFRLLTGKEIARVAATMHSRTHQGAVEDYSLLTMHTDDGVSGLVETGYSFPKHCRRTAGIFVHHLIGSDVREIRSGPDRDSRPQ